jgi:hypothetical protein
MLAEYLQGCSRRRIYMQFLPFYSIIDYWLKGTGMKGIRIWLDYIMKFRDPHFTDVQWGHREWPCRYVWSGSHWWHLHSLFAILTKVQIKGIKVSRTRWPSDRSVTANPFSGNLRFKKTDTFLWKYGGAPSCGNSTRSGRPSSEAGMADFSTRLSPNRSTMKS